MSLFGVDIAQIVADGFSGQLNPATLTREVEVDYDEIEDEAITSTSSFTSEGIVEAYEDRLIAGGLVEQNDRKILLLANPLGTTPKPGDTITIEGESFSVVGTPERDPAGATWTIQGRL